MKSKKLYKSFLPNVKFSFGQLLFLSLLSILLLFVINNFSSSEYREIYTEMIKASNRMKEANQSVGKHRKVLNLEINRNLDPLQSGFIGTEFSPITTTLGDIEAKQISTNPDFAALFVLWFNQLELKKNEQIVIHLSGSFPSLGIAAIVAAESYGLKPLILSSIGASSFGANYPEMTYWDIESFLYKEGIISHRTSYATLGGQNDNGSSFWEGGLEVGIKAAKRNNLKLNIFNHIDEAIESKLDFIINNDPFSLFINIGGNQCAIGNSPSNIFSAHGLIGSEEIKSFDVNSLLYIVTQMNIPIIHMLNIKDIALENGIDLIPNQNYKVGESDLYFVMTKPKMIIIAAILLLTIALITIKIRSN
ncbi:MAG: poly-gamma-glutamate system protein [Bacteroidota bacterium]